MSDCKKADDLSNNCPDTPSIVGLISPQGGPNPCTHRYTDKDTLANAAALFDNYWRTQIQQYGTRVNYYVHTYNKDLDANHFLGEHPTQRFHTPYEMVIAVQLEEGAANLREFGYDPDDDLTAFIHIKEFKETVLASGDNIYEQINDYIEPKSGDVIELSEFGCSRPGIRTSKFFEVTSRKDSAIQEGINTLSGHYVWKITAKILDYTWQPGLPDEARGHTIYDHTHHGRLQDDPTADPPIIFSDPATPDKYIRKDGTDKPIHYDSDNDDEVEELIDPPTIGDDDIFGGY